MTQQMLDHDGSLIFQLVSGASGAAMAIGRNRKVVAWNDAASELLGYRPREALDRDCGAVLRAEYPDGNDLCSGQCRVHDSLSCGQAWGLSDCVLRHKDGQGIPAEISTIALPARSRHLAGDAVALIFMRRRSGDVPMACETRLQIRTFGHFGLSLDGKPLNCDGWRRQQALIVLKCLVVNRTRPVHRDRLIEWLWPEEDPERAWPRLKVAVSFLRARLRAAGMSVEIIETVGQSYRLRKDAVWIDADAFEARLAEVRQRPRAADPVCARNILAEAERLFRGDFLEDDPYAEWCAAERARLFDIHLDLLANLAQVCGKVGDFSEAAAYCLKALALDPTREGFVRVLMEVLVAEGKTNLARAQFARWRRSLAEDYDLEPMPETWAVVRRLDRAEPDSTRVTDGGIRPGFPRAFAAVEAALLSS